MYSCEWDAALAHVEEQLRIARRLALPHSEVFALESVAILHLQRGENEQAAAAARAGLDLAREVGSRRYEAILLWVLGELSMRSGDRDGAAAHFAEGRAIMQATGIGGFIGAPLCAGEAKVAFDPPAACRALAEGEDWLARGSIGHCHYWYRADAIDVALALADHDLALHHCAALEAYAAAEPLPWSDFHVARGRAMVAFDRLPDEAGRAALAALREQAVTLGFKSALPQIDAALRR
jgi:hypothetical protein